MKYEHLLGLEFNMEHRNYYTLLRDFYRDNYQIELPDYPNPQGWWERGLDLYARLASQNGFDIIHDHPRDWRPGDVIVMAINSSSGNHVGVVLDNGKILHHLVGQRSRVTTYGGLFRNTTVGVYRHREVAKLKTPEHIVDIREILPPHVRRRLEEAAQEVRGDGAGTGRADPEGREAPGAS